jgi:hypothetical protein
MDRRPPQNHRRAFQTVVGCRRSMNISAGDFNLELSIRRTSCLKNSSNRQLTR